MMKLYDKKYLYKLTFPNGKAYFGVSRDIFTRWSNEGLNYKHQQVYKHIQKFGWENIKKEILYEGDGSYSCDRAVLNMEKALIEIWGKHCYNEVSNPTRRVCDRRLLRKGTGAKWTIDGQTKPATDWCEEYGVFYSAVLNRIRRYGLSPKQAMTYPSVPTSWRRNPIGYWSSLGLRVGNVV